MDTATCYRHSDPNRNRQFSRRWHDPAQHPAPPAPVPAEDAEPGMATLIRWREEWRARRAARTSSEKGQRTAGSRT